ncbi:nucleotidyltransferase domain-containing protein [Actinoplanes sp. NPDC051343]|uniref:nucleotidyltransferase domain-containing protein n=1 Tax=Actinoplanes sp. NPDC051343 TaxID=3363906 RepID=UPI00378DB455
MEDILERIHQVHSEWPLSIVREIHVFGSFARGALHPGDVDLYVDLEKQDKRWKSTLLNALTRGYDPHRVFRQALVGRKRGAQFTFEPPDIAAPGTTLLWRRGESRSTALARLHAIKEDPLAGRAERDAMLPQFEGMDHWLPLYCRESLIEAIDREALHVERLVLEDRDITHPRALEHLKWRWPSTSPLYRAGRAVFAHFLSRGVDPTEVHLHGQDVCGPGTPYFVGFQLRYLGAAQHCLTADRGREWIEVVHPSRRGDIYALRLLPDSPSRLATLDWL